MEPRINDFSLVRGKPVHCTVSSFFFTISDDTFRDTNEKSKLSWIFKLRDSFGFQFDQTSS